MGSETFHGLIIAEVVFMKTFKNGWGRKLRLWRLGVGLTQKDLAEGLKIKQATLSRWEASAEPPELQPALGRLAVMMQISIEDLIHLGDRHNSNDPSAELEKRPDEEEIGREPLNGVDALPNNRMHMLNRHSRGGERSTLPLEQPIPSLEAVEDYPELKRLLGEDWYYVSANAREMIYEFLLSEVERNKRMGADYKEIRAYDGTREDKERVREKAEDVGRKPRGFK